MFSALPAAQAASTWDLGGSACQAIAGSTYGNSATCGATSGTGTVSVYAWGGANATGSTGYQTAYLSPQGASYGYGVASQYETKSVGAPNHSMDNDPTTSVTPDLIVLKFSTAVALDTIKLGWSQSDADFTVMAYTGATTGTTDAAKMDSFIKGKNASNLTTATAGWSLIENSGDNDGASAGYANNSNDITKTVNNGAAAGGAKNVTSSWWIISAYNSGFGGGTLDSLQDYMKLLAVSTKDITAPATVPEPGSLALAGLALFGLVYSRRQAQRKS